MTNGPESADAPRRSRRAADVPVDAPAGPRERESQQRARDREALRASKALADKQARAGDSANPPTRRQLRLQQQERAAEAKPAVAPAPVPPAATGKRAVPPAPAARAEKPPAAAAQPAQGAGKAVPAKPAKAARPEAATQAEPKPPQAAKPAQAVKPTQAAKPAQAVKPVQAVKPAQAVKSAESRPAPESARRDRRRRSADTEPPANAGAVASEADPNADVAGMTVEQALAARQALQAQARNQVAAMEAIQKHDPDSVDPELLAQQKALAERAAVLNRRTQNIQRLSQENEQRKPSAGDPTTAHNLAMVTPLEFVRVPGVERPVMKPPSTSHVPIVTSNTPQQKKAGLPAPPNTAPRSGDRRFEVRRPAGSADVRHSRILARADALVNAPLDLAEGAKPVGARNAFGLDPLDVMTAGLGRTRRLRFVSLGVVGLGMIALIIGVAMIIGGLGS